MRRVVVTGMGIWSCIGRNKEEVSASLHAGKSGIIKDIKISDKIKDDIVLYKNWLGIGQDVKKYDNASFNTGIMLIKHKNIEEMCYRMDHMEKFIKVEVE